MSFLFPLYLLGAAALAIPILLHLRKRPPKEHIPFSSHLFLEKTPERLTRRTRLERWFLLALRCLALLLLALAFARPFLRSLSLPSDQASRTRAMVLVDRSASMQREDLWKRAVAAAKEEIERYGAADEVALALFDEELEIAADFPTWAALGTRARSAAWDGLAGEEFPEASWLATDLGLAMTRAADLLLAADVSDPVGRRELVVISDFQDGARRDRLQSEAWPEEVEVRIVPLEAEEPGNLSLNLAATPARSSVEEEEVYRVRIRNASDSEETVAVLSWKGFPETAIRATVAPGTSRILTSAPRPAEAARGILEVEGDKHPFDNEVFLSPVQARPLRVLFLSESDLSESAGSPLFYLRRALQPTPTLNPLVRAEASFAEEDLEGAEVVVVAGSWAADTGRVLRRFAEGGGLVVAIPGPEAAADSLAVVTGEEGWTLSEADAGDYSLLADLDFEHPVLQPFARARIRDFTKIRFWRHRQLELPDPAGEETRVVATFDGEMPALVEHRVGDGAVFAFLSGWEPKESQLALSSKFVPLLFSILEHSGFSIRSAATLYVGETEHARPGFYSTGEGEDVSLEAVNLAPSEGETAPFDPAVAFPGWGIPLFGEAESAATEGLTEAQLARLESEEKEELQKLWKWLVLGTLLILVAESWLAGRFGGRRGRKPGVSPGTAPAASST